ncbi:MAG: beta-N-acetylglucosaminidase domain-containing protein [Caulobacteraceae bacterium]
MALPIGVPLGLIEGYYGEPWSWAEREATISFLAPHGYGFYIYAPKADAFLRERWREAHPKEVMEPLARVAETCRSLNVRFGVGLSPFEIWRGFDDEAKTALAAKVATLSSLGLDDLAILFDDMRGDFDDLAKTQIRIVEWIAERAGAMRLIVCPTYYSDDPLLDSGYGERPKGYLEALGSGLDPAVEVFWTGEEVCSRAYGLSHLERVADQLRRKPFLWDNYPVNDGAVMGQSLHLRGFTGRPAAMGAALSAHAVNPALQSVLSRIPALTLVESYRQGEAYAYGAAFAHAAEAVLGPDLAGQVRRNLYALQNTGLDRLGERAHRLAERYRAFDHPGAAEIVRFLEGGYAYRPLAT